MREWDDLLLTDPIDEAKTQALVNRFGNDVYEVERRLDELEAG